MPPEAEVVRGKEPLLARNGVMNGALPWDRTTGRREGGGRGQIFDRFVKVRTVPLMYVPLIT